MQLRELQGLADRVSKLEQSANDSNSSELDEIMKKIRDLEKEMNNRVDCDTFDNEIAALRAMIGNMDNDNQKSGTIQTAAPPRPAGPSISTKDLNLIKEILAKFPTVEETQIKILK